MTDNRKKMKITNNEKSLLLQEVRKHLEHKLLGNEAGSLPESGLFTTKPGIFVTLHKKGDLRGCIGHIVGHDPLSKSLYDLAEASAFQDPRFNSLDKSELDEIKIEISLLSEPEQISRWQDIEIGKHGILIKKGYSQAVFLPQVAPEQGWDLETTLANLCQKAGLHSNAYKENEMEFYVYTATVFSE